MAVLFDDNVVAYQLIALSIPTPRPVPYFIYYAIPDVQLTSIVLLGIHRVYRLRAISIGTVPTVFDTRELRAPAHAFEVALTGVTGVQDGIQFIPTYDFDRVQIIDNRP